MFFDGGIISAKMGHTGLELGPKCGSNHVFHGRFSIPLVVATFLSFVSAIAKYNAGVENYVEHGIIISGIIMIPLYMIGFIIVKQFLDIPFIWLTNKYGVIVEWASSRFDPTSAEEFQLGGVTLTYEQQDILGKMIKEREELINNLKEAIKNNIPYAKCDRLCTNKSFPLRHSRKKKETPR